MTEEPAGTRSHAPWTLDEVHSLSSYQAGGFMHPFTCPHRTDGNHGWSVLDRVPNDVGVLVPTLGGWYCRDCHYVQEWAWTWMVDGSWRTYRW